MPWTVVALTCLAAAGSLALFSLSGGLKRVSVRHESGAYLILGAAATAAVGLAVWAGPGGAHAAGFGWFVAHNGPLAFAGLLLTGVPVLAGLILGGWTRLAPLAAIVLIALVGGLAIHAPRINVALASGPIPDWRTNPAEPYPFTTPVPPLVATVIDGSYDRPPTETFPGGKRPHCTRCQPYPPDGGRSVLTLDRGRYYLEQVTPAYRATGHYVVTGNHITLFNDPECSKVRGVYRWRVADGQLTLTTLFDLCGFGQRSRDLTDAVWTALAEAPAASAGP
jgi:hypothetical protein